MDSRKRTAVVEVTERAARAALRRELPAGGEPSHTPRHTRTASPGSSRSNGLAAADAPHLSSRFSTPLSSEEEKVLRMRLGASLPASGALARLEAASDVEIELLAYEIEAWLHHRGAAVRAPPQARIRAFAPAPSRTKEKIVRALRRK